MICGIITLLPGSVSANFLYALFNTPATPTTTADTAASDYSLVDTPLLSALTHSDPTAARGGAEIVVNDGALVSTGPVGEDVIAEESYSTGEIRVYTVRPGDTPSHIADMFGVSVNTLFWANDITNGVIQPGDTLVILPISGVYHTIVSGDTISTIAAKYDADADEILSYNQLASVTQLAVGDELIIPGGAMHQVSSRTYAAAQPTNTSGVVSSGGYFIHPVPGAIKTQGIHGYNAIDLAAGHGTPIRVAASGEVIVSKSSGWNGGYGQYIVVRHSNGTQTLYSHLSQNDVGVGAYVSQGQTIGRMGSTGRSTGTHLHFEIRGARNPF